MSEPITIGGQTFVKTNEGWIDKKSKLKAPEGLTSLLEKMQTENSAEVKKKRVRIDTTRKPVVLGNTEYAWDLNSKVWIDKKTKAPANPRFSSMIEAVYQSTLDDSDKTKDKKKIADDVVKSMGSAGQVAKQRTRKPSGSGKLPVPNIKINSPIVQMIEKLAVIDGYLKQRLDNQKMIAAKIVTDTKEQQIESAAVDAQPVIDEERIDAEVEAENKKSNAALLTAAIGAAGLIATQFDPVKEAFSGIVDFAKGVYSYFKDFVSITSSALDSINSGTKWIKETLGFDDEPQSGSSTPSSSSSTSTSSSSSSSTSTQPVQQVAEASPVQQSNSDEIVVTAPRAATPVSSSSDEIVVTAPRRSGGSSSSSSRGSSGSPAPASRAAASPPTSGPPAPASSLSSAQNGTVWAGTDASGMKTFVRKINNKYETWTSADGTHYNIDESQAQAQITSRKLRNVNTGDASPQTAADADIPQNNIVALGKYLQGQGLRISGHSQFGGQERGSHSANSRHYRDMAIDVNVGSGVTEASDPTAGPRFDKLASDLRAAGYSVIWRAKDHYDHLHASVGGPEGADSSGEGADQESTLEKMAGAGWEMTKGAIEAVANIIRAGAGNYTRTIGSQLTGFDTEMSKKSNAISASERDKNAVIAASRTSEDLKASPVMDPKNLNAGSNNPVVQNLPSSSDFAGVDFYLTRMGFPKIEYNLPVSKTSIA